MINISCTIRTFWHKGVGFSTMSFSDKNLMKNLKDEYISTLNNDNRAKLFRKSSKDYTPTGSVLKVYYYNLPLPEGVKIPIRPNLSTTLSSNAESTFFSFNPSLFNETLDEKKKSQLQSYSVFAKWWSSTPTSPLLGYYHRPSSLQPQSFLGRLICVRRNSCNTTFTLRNAVDGVGIEMTFSLYSPLLVAIQVIHKYPQKKSKMYYLRTHPIQESIVTESKSSLSKTPPPYHYLTTIAPTSPKDISLSKKQSQKTSTK